MPHEQWLGDRTRQPYLYNFLARQEHGTRTPADVIPGRMATRKFVDALLDKVPGVGGISGKAIVKEAAGGIFGGGVGTIAGKGVGAVIGKTILAKTGRGFTAAATTLGGRLGAVAGAGLLLADIIDTGVSAIEGDVFTSAAGAGMQAARPVPTQQNIKHKGGVKMEPGVSLMLRDQSVGNVLPSPTGAMVTNTWVANGTPFVQTADGWIYVQRRNGSIKRYRPPKNIVISRNPRVGSLLKADKKLSRLKKGLRKVVK